ncbi:DNA primase [hydrothermal vent metagenome]|uniref:DNA primase n=1 Tax=hydrothermal vent metagenome TaxID=652676 RepID=A0A1W1C2D6_9ZZZZ
MIAQESIEALKARLDVVDVIGSYIELKKSGANFKAPCPFHDEKSPSFVVSPSKQIYHCFGCGAGGDAIKFVMDYEHLSYPEAIEKLASTYGFTLSYTTSQKRQSSEILEKINTYYQSLLPHTPMAIEYLQERGVYESSIEKFGIGYAPSSQQTIEWIKKNYLSMQDALRLGVIGSDGNRSYARFIERITFPIQSPSGMVVGFGGRTITGHQAKYINSPETPLFNKSRLLYAYNLARNAIYKKKEIIITEGYLDVVMLHQAGFENSVATLGTALTKEHLPLLRKAEPKVIMAYDGDSAGISAAIKAARLLSVSGFDGGVVLFGGGMDPADMVKEGKIEELERLFLSPTPFIDFVLNQITTHYNLHDPKAKEACLHEMIGYLKTLSPLLQEEYKPYVASRLGISPSLIRLSGNIATLPQQPQHQNAPRDLWELTLIKTILEHPEFSQMVLDVLDPSKLQFHSWEFEMALRGEREHPRILDILLDDEIKALESTKALKAELITYLVRHYERELKKINFDKSINFEKKAYLIRKIRDKITRLKRGELVVLD